MIENYFLQFDVSQTEQVFLSGLTVSVEAGNIGMKTASTTRQRYNLVKVQFSNNLVGVT